MTTTAAVYDDVRVALEAEARAREDAIVSAAVAWHDHVRGGFSIAYVVDGDRRELHVEETAIVADSDRQLIEVLMAHLRQHLRAAR